jgi:hypothetical protein
MVLIRECDEEGKLVQPTERKKCLRHAIGPDGVINWDIYHEGLLGEELFSDLSSESSANLGSDSDCVFLYATSGTNRKEDESQEIRPYQKPLFGLVGGELSSRLIGMASFAEEVLVEESLYVDVSAVDSFRRSLTSLPLGEKRM